MGRRQLLGQRIQPILAPDARLIWKNLSLLLARRDRRSSFREVRAFDFRFERFDQRARKLQNGRAAISRRGGRVFFHRAGFGIRLPWGTAQARLRLIWPTGWRLGDQIHGAKHCRIWRPRIK